MNPKRIRPSGAVNKKMGRGLARKCLGVVLPMFGWTRGHKLWLSPTREYRVRLCPESAVLENKSAGRWHHITNRRWNAIDQLIEIVGQRTC